MESHTNLCIEYNLTTIFVMHPMSTGKASPVYVSLQAGKTLSVRKWHAAFTPEGYLDISKTLSRIQHGVDASF